MPRPVLEEAKIHPAIRDRLAAHQQAVLDEVRAAVQANDVVVVGMGVNPYPKQALKALAAIGQPCKYLSYGNYISGWRQRTALKMWTGWPTFPMVFVRGTLVGGAADLQALIARGEMPVLLATGR